MDQHKKFWFWAEGGWMCYKCVKFVKNGKCECTSERDVS